MTGIIERLLTKRYGDPEVVSSRPFVELHWNASSSSRRCVLYRGRVCNADLEAGFETLRPLYGEIVGGFLLGVPSCLKLAMVSSPVPFGLFHISELKSHPRLIDAVSLNDSIRFFMDAANVWYYGVDGNTLYVYDADNHELDSLGPVEIGFEKVLVEWERAAPQCG